MLTAWLLNSCWCLCLILPALSFRPRSTGLTTTKPFTTLNISMRRWALILLSSVGHFSSFLSLVMLAISFGPISQMKQTELFKSKNVFLQMRIPDASTIPCTRVDDADICCLPQTLGAFLEILLQEANVLIALTSNALNMGAKC